MNTTKSTECIDCKTTFTFIGRCRKRCDSCAAANKAKLREGYNKVLRDRAASFNGGEALGTNNRSLFHRLDKLVLAPYSEVAKREGISDRAVRVIELKALAKIRAALDPFRRARSGEAHQRPALKSDGRDTRWDDLPKHFSQSCLSKNFSEVSDHAAAATPLKASSKRGTLFRKVRARIRSKWATPALYPEVRAARVAADTAVNRRVDAYLAELSQRPAPLDCVANSEEIETFVVDAELAALLSDNGPVC